MRILRLVLLVASAVGAVYIFHILHTVETPGADQLIAWLFGLGLILNFIFLLFCRPISTGNSRVAYLLRLWYDSKLRELRERAGRRPPPLG